jgi:RNA polymerase sigma factor (sigma-70 family)
MARQKLDATMRNLRKFAALHAYRDLADHDLLERFIDAHDEAAFTVLIEKHGPMVLGVCRRALANQHDAEDACQATFLVLSRKAKSISKKASLGSWLHGVARRVSASLKREQARRKTRERRRAAVLPKNPAGDASWSEVQAVLDEELQQLPDRYRAPLILCYLECLTRDEAAAQLGVTPGSLHGLLERGRDLLRKRLVKRGLALSATLSAIALGESLGHALSPTFVLSSSRAAALLAAGKPLPEGAVAAQVLTLTQEVVKSMFFTKLKLGAAGLVCLVATLVGGGFSTQGFAQDKQPLGIVVRDIKLKDAESDKEFLVRISKDLRGVEPSPAELHFFLANKDANKRTRAVDLFIQERQAKQAAENTIRARLNINSKGEADLVLQLQTEKFLLLDRARKAEAEKKNEGMPFRIYLDTKYTTLLDMGGLQQQFFKDLNAAKDKADIAKATQAHLDRLVGFVKNHPKSPEVSDAMRQIATVYDSQGKTVEAGAWREKLKKETPAK